MKSTNSNSNTSTSTNDNHSNNNMMLDTGANKSNTKTNRHIQHDKKIDHQYEYGDHDYYYYEKKNENDDPINYFQSSSKKRRSSWWNEILSLLSHVGLVLLSYFILLYLTSYSKSECPSFPLSMPSSFTSSTNSTTLQ